jgi:tight adherence protein B
MLLLIVFVLSLASTVAVVLMATRPAASQKAVQARLSTISKRIAKDDASSIELTSKARFRFSDRISAKFENYHIGEKLERLIVHSGSTMTVGQIILTGAGIAAALGLMVQHIVGMFFISLPSAGIGALVPYGLLRFQKGRRLKKFNEALPDAIELMARALRAGHSMGSSIEVIAQQSPEPLASEFETCFQKQKFGIPFRDALTAMGERVPSEDLHFLITAVLVQKETGGDLTDILDRTTHLIRDRIRIQGEIRTYTAQGRMTGWILGLMPVFMLLILNLVTPGYSDVLFHDPLGQKLLMAGGVFIVIGGLIIRKIVDIKV